jgi:putative phosphoesterase
MLIGVISDTHIPERANTIPEIVFEIFKEVDLILHAGDLVSLEVRDQLEKIAPTICVQGNMDRYTGFKTS